jgi:hypothetical protein
LDTNSHAQFDSDLDAYCDRDCHTNGQSDLDVDRDLD